MVEPGSLWSSAIMIEDIDLVARLLVAGILGAALGWERERAEKAAGLRTHILVAVTSTLFVVLAGVWTHPDATTPGALRVDPIRAIQAVAIGVGFLGSGIVFFDESRPRGLTTAASVWATSAIGVSVGFSRLILAIAATAIVLITLRFLTRFDHPKSEARNQKSETRSQKPKTKA